MKTKLYYFLALLSSLLSIGLQAQIKVVERPAFDAWNNSTLEFDKIELSDTATVLYIDGFIRPGGWFGISKDTYIRESGKTEKLQVKHAEGIQLEEKIGVDQSGKASFKLFFPPLAKNVTKIDFMESDCDECFKTWGIYLNGQKPAPTPLPKEATSSQPLIKALPTPQIKAGTAIFSGKIVGSNLPEEMKSKPMMLEVSNVITGERAEYQITVQKDGSFSKEIPIVSPTLAVVESSFYRGLVYLDPAKESGLYVDLQQKCKQESRYQHNEADTKPFTCMVNGLGLSADDLDAVRNKSYELLDRKKLLEEIEGMGPEAYKTHVLRKMDEGLQLIQSDPKTTEGGKQLIGAEFKLFTLLQLVSYNQNAKIAYAIKNNIKVKSLSEIDYNPEKPAVSYYSFVKDFDLNNPQHLYTMMYSTIPALISSLPVYNLPKEKTSISEWMNSAKQAMKNDIGSDCGIFYDLLAARQYSKQLGELQAFTDEQKTEMKTIFSNSAFAAQLLVENDKMLQLTAKNTANKDVIINETPAVEKEKVLDAILAKYKGKVVFVDLWATWCGPCRKAMKDAEPVKKSFKDKDVVFVYLTGETSPMKKWQDMLPGIHGEHYRVSDAQWDYWYKSLEIEGVPSYFIYDKNGVQKHKSVGFMGTEKMQKWISESL